MFVDMISAHLRQSRCGSDPTRTTDMIILLAKQVYIYDTITLELLSFGFFNLHHHACFGFLCCCSLFCFDSSGSKEDFSPNNSSRIVYTSSTSFQVPSERNREVI